MVAPCVTSALSADNLNQVRDNGISSSMATANNNNNNNRVSSAVSAGNVSKIQNAKVTGKFSELSILFFYLIISLMETVIHYQFGYKIYIQ